MNTAAPIERCTQGFELRFASLFNEGRALAFPCDAGGRVDIDAMSERSRSSYFYARSVIGREFACPSVRPQAAC